MIRKKTSVLRAIGLHTLLRLAFVYLASTGVLAMADTGGVVETTLNELKIAIDERTGSIIGLDYPGPGRILEAKPEGAGIVDVAYPIPEFEPLRLASRYSKGARVEKSDDAVVISWDNLGASRSFFNPSGNVSAKVWLKAMPDGRSISMKSRIENKSERPVGQILFPDFHGLLPIAGAEGSDARATFSGEITGSSERSANFLDYTWNWESGSYHHNLGAPYRDDRAFIASFPSPRLNKGINRNAQHIKTYFMDNGYLNVMPSAPDDANGTAWIKDYPDVGRVLKQCAGLRRQFLRYFTEGTLIGECLLKEPSPGAHVDAYVLPDRVLLMIMNTSDETRRIEFNVDLEPWLKAGAGKYDLRSYDENGKGLSTGTVIGHDWNGETQAMKSLEFAIFEFIAR